MKSIKEVELELIENGFVDYQTLPINSPWVYLWVRLDVIYFYRLSDWEYKFCYTLTTNINGVCERTLGFNTTDGPRWSPCTTTDVVSTLLLY